MQKQLKRCLFLCASAAALASFFIFNYARAESSLFISQVQITGGPGKTTYDFIELYNSGDAPVNLNGYRLVKRSASATKDSSSSIKSWISDTCVPGKSFYLWANSNFADIGATPNVTTIGDISNNYGVALRLGAADTGTIVDSIAWGTANNGFRNVSAKNPEAGQALVRRDLAAANSVFVIASSTPRNSLTIECPISSPTASSSPASTENPQSSESKTISEGSVFVLKSDEVKISEVLPNPEGEDSGFERVELYNSGAVPVDLTNWYLDDKPENGSLGNSAYQLLGESILPEGFLVLSIPKDYFVLNNTGGDELNLYFADKTLADSVSYKEDAKEGLSYQRNGESWIWGRPTWGAENFMPTDEVVRNYDVYVNEFMPNPLGPDEGQEWVEFYNQGTQSASLKGFILDRESSAQAKPGRDALTLNDSAVVPAGGYLLVTIPEDNFSLTNDGDVLRLFSPEGKFLQQISFTQAPEGQSYSRQPLGAWQFAKATPNAANAADFVKPEVVISEVLPNPEAGGEEFLEFYNLGSQPVDFKNLALRIGNRLTKFEADQVLAPQSYYVLSGDSLPVRLNNSGQTLILEDVLGNRLSQVTYGKAPVGQAYALGQGEDYFWTASPTPGQSNQLVLGASTGKNPSAAEAAASKITQSSSPVSSKLLSALEQSNQELQDQVANLQTLVMDLSGQITNLSGQLVVPQAQATQSISPLANSGERPSFSYLFVALAALAGFLLLAWKFFRKQSP